VNHSLVLASEAQTQMAIGDTDLALALALEAARMEAPPPEAVRTRSAVALGPCTRDGRSAFSVDAGGTLIQWRLAEWTIPQLTEWARANRYPRELTCEERARYRVEPLCGSR
jgi:hypothetical protein